MGRLKRRNKQKKRPSKQNRKAHESDPEPPGTETRENSPTSTAWSCDEQALVDYVQVASDGSVDMEVTRRLSSLNFEVIPCALDPANFRCPRNERELEHLDHCPKESSCNHTVGDGFLVSEELCTSATNLDVLPGVESHWNSRQGRKRCSRRRVTKKAKKMKCSYGHVYSSKAASSGHCHGHGRKMKRSVLSQARYNPMFLAQTRRLYDPLSHSQPFVAAFSAVKKMELDDDNMSCLFSDTSAACDMEMVQDTSGGTEMFDCTPPANPTDSGFPSHHDIDDDLSSNGSDLSDSSTTDSGCEGDDEESSVEGPSHLRLPGWWDKDPACSSTDEEDEKFSRILNGSFPLMSEDGRQAFKERLILPEFKHPGKFGIRGSVRKKKRKPTHPDNHLTPREIDQKISVFVQSSEPVTELSFQLVSRPMCRTISRLAAAYNLQCVVEQKRRLPVASPVLRKTALTVMASRLEVEKILRSHGRDSPITLFKGTDAGAVQCELQPVGGEAPPLDNSNRGNRMLQGLGWRPGTGLGPHGTGIKEPVLAYPRPRHMGLGY